MHWIQAKKAAEDLNLASPGQLVSLHGARVTLLVHHELREYVVRDPEWLEWLLESYGTRIRLQERWGVLRIRNFLIGLAHVPGDDEREDSLAE